MNFSDEELDYTSFKAEPKSTFTKIIISEAEYLSLLSTRQSLSDALAENERLRGQLKEATFPDGMVKFMIEALEAPYFDDDLPEERILHANYKWALQWLKSRLTGGTE
jgi:hypothetical protein